ncbi:hypothetical protein FACS189490_12580 [Clostridia bacterium]|nr:hypothetical protein FACS189490_12580 [Clostridia bacterium]
MDINCVYNCVHQREGKCALSGVRESIPAASVSDNIDCLYYSSAKISIKS